MNIQDRIGCNVEEGSLISPESGKTSVRETLGGKSVSSGISAKDSFS